MAERALVSERVYMEFSGLGVMEPAETTELAKRGLIVARLLVKPEEERLPIRVFNPGRRTFVVKGGGMAGILTPVEDRDIKVSKERIKEIPGHLEDLYTRSIAGVDREYHTEIAKLLCKYQDVFSKGNDDTGRTESVKHHIEMRGQLWRDQGGFPYRSYLRMVKLRHSAVIGLQTWCSSRKRMGQSPSAWIIGS